MAFLQNILKPGFSRILGSVTPASATILNTQNDIFTTQKRFAARKGKRIAATREKQKLARIRREELKNQPPKVWKPKKFLVDKNLNFISRKFNDNDRKGFDEIYDNVYILKQYKEKKLPFLEALQLIRETHDPTMFGEPDAILEAKVEFDLRTKKKSKFVEKFRSIISYENEFPYAAKRKIVAICKTDEDIDIAKLAGAEMSGSMDIINMLKAGEITMDNFDDLVCHGDMLVPLAAIKTTVGKYFPTKTRGNIGFDIKRLVHHFVNGIEYQLIKDDIEPDYGFIKVPFGRLSMPDEKLLQNFQTVLETFDRSRPANVDNDFISRVLIYSDPCPEMFPVAFWENIDNYENPYEDDDAAEEDEKVSAKN